MFFVTWRNVKCRQVSINSMCSNNWTKVLILRTASNIYNKNNPKVLCNNHRSGVNAREHLGKSIARVCGTKWKWSTARTDTPKLTHKNTVVSTTLTHSCEAANSSMRLNGQHVQHVMISAEHKIYNSNFNCLRIRLDLFIAYNSFVLFVTMKPQVIPFPLTDRVYICSAQPIRTHAIARCSNLQLFSRMEKHCCWHVGEVGGELVHATILARRRCGMWVSVWTFRSRQHRLRGNCHNKPNQDNTV